MFGLDTTFTILLLACILLACLFEFINGFHDTANAVATVIYTNSLKPAYAVVLSGILNAVGVFMGLGVSMKIVSLLPFEALTSPDLGQSISIVLSILLTSIIWNLGTWYFGIPCSSSHTLIGAILGAGIGYSVVAGIDVAQGVKWNKASEIGLSLLLSPLLGFALTILVMYIMRVFIKDKKFFKPVENNKKPGFYTRLLLICTCSWVSFSHGRNDGQKGIGLIILVLIAFAPAYFAINPDLKKQKLQDANDKIYAFAAMNDTLALNAEDKGLIHKLWMESGALKTTLAMDSVNTHVSKEVRFEVRKSILSINKTLDKIYKSETFPISKTQKHELESSQSSIKKYVEYAPIGVIVMVALSLGLGTMIGWKRIVKTIGEKIGKEHLSYAQGASAELVASTTIEIATNLSLPVSTTQVLSSGIAGSMVASKGIKNLQKKTIKTIALAWLLTLPVTVALSMLLYLLFKSIF